MSQSAAARVERVPPPPPSAAKLKPNAVAPAASAPSPEEQHVANTLKELRTSAREFEFEARSALAHAELLGTCGHTDIEALVGAQIPILRRFVNYAELFEGCAAELSDTSAAD